MPKLLSSKAIIKVLEIKGFVFVSQKGSHIKYRKQGSVVLTVIIPANKKEIPYGTLMSIIRQAKLNKDDFK